MDNGKQDSSGDGFNEYVQGTPPNSMMDLTFPGLISSASSHTSFTLDLILPTNSAGSSSSNGNQNIVPPRLNHTSETSDLIDRTSVYSSSGVEGLGTTGERTSCQRSQQTERRGKEESEDAPETSEQRENSQKRKREDQEKMQNGCSPSRDMSIGTKDEQIPCNRSEAQDLRFLRENAHNRESPEARADRLRRKKPEI